MEILPPSFINFPSIDLHPLLHPLGHRSLTTTCGFRFKTHECALPHHWTRFNAIVNYLHFTLLLKFSIIFTLSGCSLSPSLIVRNFMHIIVDVSFAVAWIPPSGGKDDIRKLFM